MRISDWSSDVCSSDLLSTVVPSLAGPKRPQDRVLLTGARENFETALTKTLGDGTGTIRSAKVDGEDFELRDGQVMIAAINSCTNTANPRVLVAAGMVGQKANDRGRQAQPWVQTREEERRGGAEGGRESRPRRP